MAMLAAGCADHFIFYGISTELEIHGTKVNPKVPLVGL